MIAKVYREWLANTFNQLALIKANDSLANNDGKTLDIAKAESFFAAMSVEERTAYIDELMKVKDQPSNDSVGERLRAIIPEKYEVLLDGCTVHNPPRKSRTSPRSGAGKEQEHIMSVTTNAREITASAINLTVAQANWLCSRLKSFTGLTPTPDKANYHIYDRVADLIELKAINAKINVRNYEAGDVYISPDGKQVGTCEVAWPQANISSLSISLENRARIKHHEREDILIDKRADLEEFEIEVKMKELNARMTKAEASQSQSHSMVN